MQSELKPCAHCGGAAECDSRQAFRAMHSGEIRSRFAIYCTSCNSDMGFCYDDIESSDHDAAVDQTITAWNTRASDAEITRLTEALRDAEEREKALREDKARLDYLDKCNHRLNSRYGTSYGWKLILNHNVNRLMLDTPSGMAVDLHDTEGGSAKFTSCRKAIDESMLRAAIAGAKPSHD